MNGGDAGAFVARAAVVSEDVGFVRSLRTPELDIVDVGSDRDALWDALGPQRIDVVLIDDEVPQAMALCAEVAAREPNVPVLVVGRSDDEDAAPLAAVRAGAHGYAVKSADDYRVLEAIRSLASGEGFLDPSVTLRVLSWATHNDGPSVVAGLSPREIEVLGYVLQGEPNKRIARRMGLTENTVKTYLRRAYRKLGCHTRTAAAAKLARLGFP
jgi:DNA-binding NarL/FixJ family response regulator